MMCVSGFVCTSNVNINHHSLRFDNKLNNVTVNNFGMGTGPNDESIVWARYYIYIHFLFLTNSFFIPFRFS